MLSRPKNVPVLIFLCPKCLLAIGDDCNCRDLVQRQAATNVAANTRQFCPMHGPIRDQQGWRQYGVIQTKFSRTVGNHRRIWVYRISFYESSTQLSRADIPLASPGPRKRHCHNGLVLGRFRARPELYYPCPGCICPWQHVGIGMRSSSEAAEFF